MAVRYISQDEGDTHFGLSHTSGKSAVFRFADFRRQPTLIRFAGQHFTVSRRWYLRRGRKVRQIVIENRLKTWTADNAVTIIWPRDLHHA
jgi:hypothetical protein